MPPKKSKKKAKKQDLTMEDLEIVEASMISDIQKSVKELSASIKTLNGNIASLKADFKRCRGTTSSRSTGSE